MLTNKHFICASLCSAQTPSGLDDVVDLLNEEDNLLQEVSNGDFGPDENLIEVYIVDAEISETTVSSDASTFIIVDFFDYESQATTLTSGLYPRYDFATTYKVTVDDFFLRFLATDSLSIELNKAQNADYALLARGTITLSQLLEVSERSERALRKTRIRATTKLTINIILNSLPRSPPKP